MPLVLHRIILLHTLFSAWCVAQQRTGDGRVILNLGYFATYAGSDFVSSGTIPAARLAVEKINNDSSILPNHYLQLQTGLDSMCNTNTASDVYFRFWTNNLQNQTAPIFLGSGCSIATEPMLIAGRFWRTMQVSYLSSAPHLSDNSRFPYHVRVEPAESITHKSQGIIAAQFGWEEVTWIVQNEEIFVSDLDTVVEFMQRDLRIGRVNAFQFVSRLPITGIDQALADSPRVIIIDAYQRYGREVLCQLYKHGRYYPFYQIIIPGWYIIDDWGQMEVGEYNFTSDCSLSDIRTVLNNAIGPYNSVYPRNTSVIGLSGWSTDTFLDKYKAALVDYNDTDFTEYGLSAFDAVYLAALGMNASLEQLREEGLDLEGFQFEDFTRSAIYANILRKATGKVDFRGVTGPLSFDSSGHPRPADIRTTVQQYRVQPSGELAWVGIGETNFTSNRVKFNVSTGEIFPEGIPREEIFFIDIILFSVMSALAGVGVVLTFACLLFNLIFMRKKYIKLTSPLINVVICVGALLFYTTMVLLGVPTTNIDVQSALCNVSIWAPSLGFTLLFGSLIVKTWRIYYIFGKITARRFNKVKFKPPKDWMLLLVIAAMLVVDLVFLVIVTAVDSSRFYATEQRTTLSRNVVLTCTSDSHAIVLAILLVYKSIYLWVGVFLAFETHKVNIEALNDARFIALAVYCSVLTCIPLVPIGILLSMQPQARYGVLAGGIFFAITVILGLLFVPKMVGLYKRRKDNTTDAALDFALPTTNTTSGLQQVQVTAMQDEIHVLKKQLYELQTLRSTDQVDTSGHTESVLSTGPAAE